MTGPEKPATSHPPMPARQRVAPPVNPLLAPWPMPVVVVDTNVLLRSACYMAVQGSSSLLGQLALTGRAPLFIAPHVPSEFEERLPKVARQQRVSQDAARQALTDQLLPHLRVVEMTVSDHLRPEIAGVRRIHADPRIPLHRRLDGDPDDLPTAALAALLSPSVIVSADGVFSRLGLAAVGDWIPIALQVLQVAGFEASFADAVLLVDVLGRLVAAAGREAWQFFTSHPRVAFAGVALLGGLKVTGRLPQRPNRADLQRLGRSGMPLVEQLVAAAGRHERSRSGLLLVEDPSWREPDLTELCVRHLARCRQPQTATEVRDGVNAGTGMSRRVTAVACRQAMDDHPAFVRGPGGRFSVGSRPDFSLRAAGL